MPKRWRDPLLRADALDGTRIAVSASGSSDLGRLGLVEMHFRLALAELARCVLVGGGKLAYGGHLDPSGYTQMLIKELHRYGRRDKPFCIYLAWQEHRKLSKSEFDQKVEELGLFGEIICLNAQGDPIPFMFNRGELPEPVADHDQRQLVL